METWLEENKEFVAEDLASRAEEVSQLMATILEAFGESERFTAHDVYMLPSQPKDLSMYWALAMLEHRGKIQALFSDEDASSHEEMVYQPRAS